MVTRFIEITNVLDANVQKCITMTIQRRSKRIELILKVDNLHDLTPCRYLMINTSVFHDFSYQKAQRYRLPVRDSGLFCSKGGLFGFEKEGSLLQEIDGKSIQNLDEFLEAIQSIPGKTMLNIISCSAKTTYVVDGKQVVIAQRTFSNVNKVVYSTMPFNRLLCRMELAAWDFTIGQWVKSEIPFVTPLEIGLVQKAVIAAPSHKKYPKASCIINSIVDVHAFYPLAVDGILDSSKYGCGLVLNETLGLVLVSREVVKSEFCTIIIEMFGSIKTPGKVFFSHPAYNYAILTYDPKLIDAPVQRAKLSTTEIQPGDPVLSFAANNSWLLDISTAFVAGMYTVSISPECVGAKRSLSMEVLSVGATSGNTANSIGSGLIDEEGIVQALWFDKYCTTVTHIIPVLRQIEAGQTPRIRLIGAHSNAIEAFEAATMGLPESNKRRRSIVHGRG
jgi:hypothetical protein